MGRRGLKGAKQAWLSPAGEGGVAQSQPSPAQGEEEGRCSLPLCVWPSPYGGGRDRVPAHGEKRAWQM